MNVKIRRKAPIAHEDPDVTGARLMKPTRSRDMTIPVMPQR